MSEMILSDSDRQLLVETFTAEAAEVLASFEDSLLQLEQTPDDAELLHAIFRAAHTLKGNAACLEFGELSGFAHIVEEMLDRMRSGGEPITPQKISLLLDAVDALRDLSRRSLSGACALTDAQNKLLAALAQGDDESVERSNTSPATTFTPAARPKESRSLRVDMEKLDGMLDLSGEIAVARGHLHDLISGDEPREKVLDALRELETLTHALQELVIDARLVPVGPSLRHFHRVVRDLAAARQKHVNLVIEGNDVEVDATAIERLKDPITQMIRNAVDHGIEPAAERIAAGKPEAGTVRFTASHESGSVVIRLADDGRGLNEQSIMRRALALGIDIERLSRSEILSLIFRPGFSTAAKITETSGRGVGMDVVLRNVQSLRGTVSVASQPGAGTTISLRLPLTVALIEGFAVRVAGETYILPVNSILECLELPRDAGNGARGIFRLRDAAVPFVRLRSLFDLQGELPSRENVVVVELEERRVGIVIDQLFGTTRSVMKPISPLLQKPRGISGSSILGDGTVALIVDAHEIARLAQE